MWTTGWYYADPIVSAGIGLFILPRSWRLIRDPVGIAGMGTTGHTPVTILHRVTIVLTAIAATSCTPLLRTDPFVHGTIVNAGDDWLDVRHKSGRVVRIIEVNETPIALDHTRYMWITQKPWQQRVRRPVRATWPSASSLRWKHEAINVGEHVGKNKERDQDDEQTQAVRRHFMSPRGVAVRRRIRHDASCGLCRPRRLVRGEWSTTHPTTDPSGCTRRPRSRSGSSTVHTVGA